MADTDMTVAEREAFLADLHVGILAVARDGKGPLALPIWYAYHDGEVLISMDDASPKAVLLRKAGRATLTVQDERPPYRYVSVEGPVTLAPPTAGDGYDLRAVATRYLGPDLGARYAEENGGGDGSVVVRLRPERWLTVDYRKSMG